MLARVLALVAPLGLDTFAVSVALGAAGSRPWRPLVLFTAFEASMPLLGMLLGAGVGRHSAAVAGYLGGTLVAAVGCNTIRKALAAAARPLPLGSFTDSLLAGLGVSVDDIAIGFPLGTSNVSAPLVVGAMALQTLLVTGAGLFLGRRIGAVLGARTARAAEMAAGAAFLLLGSLLVAEQLLPGLRIL
ncbi:MAG TPA: manganese efflux pump [Thermoanaerobaculia bacterium]|jgi:putative Mn2+ efflux pump MntP|nr:manganese efflux pump [Thermoanaerobaculia bacterium]